MPLQPTDALGGAGWYAGLSVPSSGSSGLQHVRSQANSTAAILSVPYGGSSGMQRAEARYKLGDMLVFQYPATGRADCNRPDLEARFEPAVCFSTL